jgi:S-adenosylmethionine decarboxylase
MNDKYTPGRHLLLTLQVEDVLLLTSLDPFLEFTKDQIKVNHLNIVGTSTHTFQGEDLQLQFA